MTWGINLEELARGRDEVAKRVADTPRSHPLEQLARAHRWLEEEDAARRRFAEAARACEAEGQAHDRADVAQLGRIGSLWLLAGQADAGRPWLERALKAESRPDRRAVLLYQLGDFDGTVEAAAQEPELPYPLLEAIAALAEARRGGDTEHAAAAADGFAACIRDEPLPPDRESGLSYSLFDWLEEAHRVRAELAGEPQPDHTAILERAGLLRSGPARPPEPPPDVSPSRPGNHALERLGPEGEPVTATVVVDDWLDVTFDPLPGRDDLRVELEKLGGQWHVRVGGDELPGQFWGYREAIGVASDHLRERRARHAEWAIKTLDALARASFGT